MKLGFVYEDGTVGVTGVVCDVEDHDLDEADDFLAAVSEGCAAVGWTRSEWYFMFPHKDGGQGVKLVLCRPMGGTPVLPAFGGE
jgi:hypothetical protein